MAGHAARLRRRRRRRRRRAYAPTNNTAGHDNHEKINSWVSFSFLYEYGAPLGGPSGRRSSAINTLGVPYQQLPFLKITIPLVLTHLFLGLRKVYTKALHPTPVTSQLGMFNQC